MSILPVLNTLKLLPLCLCVSVVKKYIIINWELEAGRDARSTKATRVLKVFNMCVLNLACQTRY